MMTRTVADLPTVALPENYPLEMPSYLARMAAEHGPIFRAQLWSDVLVVFMIGPEANRFVLQTHRDHFSNDRGWTPIIGDIFGKGLLNMDDPEHARDRKLMNPAFTLVYMERYLPIMRRVIAERMREAGAQGVADVYAEARKITFDVAAEALTGIQRREERDRLRELFYAILGAQFNPNIQSEEEWLAHIGPVRHELDDLLLALIAARRNAPPEAYPDDVLALLVHARDEQGRALSDEQLLGHVNILLVAGHETSTSLSTWLLYELAVHPEYLARVHAELDALLPDAETPITLEALKAMRVLGNAMTEAGRLHPPVGNVPRGVVKPFEFNGYSIPEGTRVRYSIAASHRLQAVFANPDAFDPDRFAPPREEDKRTPYGLVTFGGGPRVCIGMNFAQTEIKALAAHVLRTHRLEPVAGHDPAMLYVGPTGFIPTGVEVRFVPR